MQEENKSRREEALLVYGVILGTLLGLFVNIWVEFYIKWLGTQTTFSSEQIAMIFGILTIPLVLGLGFLTYWALKQMARPNLP